MPSSRFARSLVLTFCTSLALPIAGGCDDAGGSGGGADASVLPATPTLLSSSPTMGATGVFEDADIVLTFDVPMDRASVEAAFSLTDVSSDDLLFTWNEASTVLTVSAGVPFVMAEGDDPDALAAIEYTATVATTARSSEGVALAEPIAVSFSTLRLLEHDLLPLASHTGSVRSDNTTWTTVWVGDSSFGDSKYVGVATFDLTSLPDGATIDLARLRGMAQVNAGTPASDLNPNFRVYEAEFASRTFALVADDLVEERRIANVSALITSIDVGVADEFIDTYDAGANRFQLAFAFDKADDADGAADNLQITMPTLHLRYTAP